MKLKRTKLAALALTALMAVGATSLVAYAEETDTAATVSSDGYVLVEDSIKFAYTVENYKVTNDSMQVEYTVKSTSTTSNDEYEVKYATATIFKETSATCYADGSLEDGVRILQVEIQGKIYYSDEYPIEQAKHSMVEIKRQTITAASHMNTGIDHVWYQCSKCGYEYYDDNYVTPVQEHDFEGVSVTYEAISNIVTDSNGKVVLDTDGTPKLIEANKDGLYYEVYYCTKYGETDEYGAVDDGEEGRTIKTKYATEGSYAMIVKQDKIADNLVDGTKYYSPTTQLPLDNDSIELEHCNVAGSYVIAYFDAEGNRISEETITVTAHHMLTNPTVEFQTTDDKAQCTVTYSTDGKTYTVKNKSCYLDIEYYEVIHCCAAGCNLDDCKTDSTLIAENSTVGHTGLTVYTKNLKTAKAEGDHVVDTTVKKAIENMVAAGTNTDEVQSYLDSVYGTGTAYVAIINDTSTCETAGKITVEYRCMVCYKYEKTVVYTKTYDVEAKGHIYASPVKEAYNTPTCEKAGSYEAVVYCSRTECGAEISRRTVTVPRVAHTNELGITLAGVGNDDDFDTECSTESSTIVKIQWTGSVVVDPGDGVYLSMAGEKVNVGEKDSDGNAIEEIYLSGYADEDDTKSNLIKYGAHAGSTEYPSMLGVYAYAASICGTCNDYTIVILDQNGNGYIDFTLEIVSVTPETTTAAGTITLKATYTRPNGTKITDTQSYPYYSTVAAYQGRTTTEPYTGLQLDSTGTYRYYVNDVFTKYTGIVEFNGGQFFVANGVLCSEANGLNLYNGTWYYLSQGQIQTQHTGFALYDGEWFYLKKGVLDTSVNGLVDYNGGTFLIAAGRLVSEYSGLWENSDGTWYFLANGQLQEYTGVAMYDGAFFKLVKGVLDVTFNGTMEYDGATFYVVNGQLGDKVA